MIDGDIRKRLNTEKHAIGAHACPVRNPSKQQREFQQQGQLQQILVRNEAPCPDSVITNVPAAFTSLTAATRGVPPLLSTLYA